MIVSTALGFSSTGAAPGSDDPGLSGPDTLALGGLDSSGFGGLGRSGRGVGDAPAFGDSESLGCGCNEMPSLGGMEKPDRISSEGKRILNVVLEPFPKWDGAGLFQPGMTRA